jgi:hypothetical protein
MRPWQRSTFFSLVTEFDDIRQPSDRDIMSLVRLYFDYTPSNDQILLEALHLRT